MTEYKILCDIGDNINFIIGGQAHTVDYGDIENDDFLNRIFIIQFHRPPHQNRLEQVIKAIQKRPEIGLRFYGDYSEEEVDWTSLVGVQNLTIDLWKTNSLKEVSSLTGLKRLSISKNVKTNVSLSILSTLVNLEILFTSISKDIETISELNNLKAVSLNDIRHDNLNYLTDLTNLKTVWLSLGSYSDFNALAKIAGLEKLRIHQVRGFGDKAANYVLSKCEKLFALKLENLAHLTRLDFIDQMASLKYLSIEGVKNLESYLPINKNKSLKTIAGYNCRPLNKSLAGLENVENIGLGDTYTKSEIERFVQESISKDIRIKGNNYRGSWDIIDPFACVDE